MQNILAFSTAGSCTVVVQTADKLVVKFNPSRRGQAEFLVPLIDSALKEAGIDYKDLHRIGIVVGPGSFTGLRVGLATARGYGLALDIPVVGISAFELYSRAAEGTDKVLVALDTQRDDCFSIGYEGDKIWLPPMVRDSATLQQIIGQVQPVLIGDALHMLDAVREQIVSDEALAESLLNLTIEANPAEQPPEPYYLRAPDIGGVKVTAA